MKWKISSATLIALTIFSNVNASGFNIYGRVTFEENELKMSSDNKLLNLPLPVIDGKEAESAPVIWVRNYRPGISTPSKLKLSTTNKYAYGDSGYACTFEAGNGNETIFGIDFPDLKASSDLWMAFCLYIQPEEKNTFEVSGWNATKKVNRHRVFSVTPGKWNFIKINIYGPGYYEEGDIVRSLSISSQRDGAKSWVVDNITVWYGNNPKVPETVSGIKVETEEKTNKLTWAASDSNLFIAKYKIYRGTIPQFKADENNLIGETEKLTFADNSLMRNEYYYIIIAEDCSGKQSETSLPVKSQQ